MVQEAGSAGGPMAGSISRKESAREVDEVTVQMLLLWIYSS